MGFRAAWAGQTGYFKLLMLAGLSLVGAFVFSIMGLLLAILFYKINIFDPAFLNDLKAPGVLESLKILQVFSSIGMFVLPPFVLGVLCDEKPLSYLQLSKSPSGRSLVLVLIIMLGALPLINFLGDWNSRMVFPEFMKGIEQWMRESEDKATELTKAFMTMDTFGQFALNMFMVALIPAMGEKLVFRGVIQRIFGEWLKNKHIAIFLSAFIFSAIHLQFYGFIPRLLLGMLFGYMLVWSGSLWLPIAAHFINNGSAVLLVYLAKLGWLSFDADKIGTPDDSMKAAWVSVLLVGLMIYLLYQNEENLKKTEIQTE